MPKLPTDLSGQELGKALERVGFVFRRQKGSHMVYIRKHPFARTVVPDHKSLKSGTLRKILHEAGLTVVELLRLL